MQSLWVSKSLYKNIMNTKTALFYELFFCYSFENNHFELITHSDVLSISPAPNNYSQLLSSLLNTVHKVH